MIPANKTEPNNTTVPEINKSFLRFSLINEPDTVTAPPTTLKKVLIEKSLFTFWAEKLLSSGEKISDVSEAVRLLSL